MLKRRKDEEEDQDVDIMQFDESGDLAPIAVNITDPEKAADIQWMEDDPDDDIHPYFPPVYPEPLEGF